MSRTYKWQTESPEDQLSFLDDIVRLFRVLSGPQVPLYLEGLPEFVVSTGKVTFFSPFDDSVNCHQDIGEVQGRSSTPRLNAPGNGSIPSRSVSPTGSHRDRTPSITIPPFSAHYQQQRKRSDNTEDSPRTVASAALPSWSTTPLQDSPRTPSRATNASPAPSIQSRRMEINDSYVVEAPITRRDQKARISFFDPINQAMLDRLILGTEPQADVEGDEESARATLASVEEMIEGYEWASDDVIGRKTPKRAVDMIEARLLDELTALEKASLQSFCHPAISSPLLGKCIFISGV